MTQAVTTGAIAGNRFTSDKAPDLLGFLTEEGLLTAADRLRVDRLYREQPDGQSLSLLLYRLGVVRERDLVQALARFTGLEPAERHGFPEHTWSDERIPAAFLREHRLMPIAESGEGLWVALADPLDEYGPRALSLALGRPVLRTVASPAAIEAALAETSEEPGTLPNTSATPGEEEIDHLRDLASEAPVIQAANHILRFAVEASASDIHVEPFESSLKVRYRVDGLLREGAAPPAHLAPALVSRIKILAGLDIAERRLPQDGSIRLRLQGKDLDMRVSTVPTLHGESVVIRLLNRDAVLLDLEQLGFTPAALEALKDALARPHGLILVTGPTGSGKTTTLYTALNRLNTPERKIITVEDPIEYQLDGINQIQARPSIGLVFANALRAIVRQDPDVIMVGEMRDLETARICVQSALTGHLVLSTLHTNSAAGAITRLLEMGLEEYLLASTINLVVGQRLVRTLCPHCRVQIPIPAELTAQMPVADGFVYRAVGCDRCDGSGYRGRAVILETLVMSDAVTQAVLQRRTTAAIESIAVSEGMTTLHADGRRKVLAGVTSLEEVHRVTQEA